MESFQLGGLISGIDTTAVINQLLTIDRQPLALLDQEEAKRTAKITEYQDINTRVKALADAVIPLQSQSLFLGKSVAVSKPEVATAVVTQKAEEGTHTLLVKELASATVLKSAEGAGRKINPAAALKDAGLTVAPATSGTFTVNGKRILWNDTMSLNDIIGVINGTAGINATAAFDATKGTLTLTSTNNLSVALGASTDTGNFFGAMRLNKAGQTQNADGQYVVESTPPPGALNTAMLVTSDTANFSSPVKEGTFTVNDVAINVYDDDMLQDILDRISLSTAGVNATYDSKTDRISLTSRKTGTEFITVGDDTSGFLAAAHLDDGDYTMGKQANFVLDGNEMWTGSNTITDLVEGATIVMKQADDAAITFTVSRDANKVQAAVEKLISAFNSVIDTIGKYTTAPVYDGAKLTQEGGELFGDNTVNSVRYALKQAVYQTLDSSFKLRSLSSVGITMGDGTLKDMSKLHLNADRLKEAILEDPDAVSKLFTDPNKGFGIIFSKAAAAQGGEFSGALKHVIDYENNRIDSIQKRRDDLNLRLKNKKTYYVNMFLDMEKSMSKIQNQGSALMNTLNMMMNQTNTSNQ